MIRPWRLEAINPRAPCFSRARRTTQVTDSRAQTSQATAATDSSVVLFMPGPPQRLRRSRDGMAKIVPYKKLLAGPAHRGGRLLQLFNVNNHKTEQKIFITKINYTSARSRGHSILSVVSVFSYVEKNE